VGQVRTTISCAALAVAVAFVQSSRIAGQSSVHFDSRWQITLPDGPSAPAAVDATHAYIPLRSGQLIAVALEDGATVWTVRVPTPWAPAAGHALVFIAGDRDIQALDAASGRPRWRAPLDHPVSIAPVFDTGWLFVGTDNGLVMALRADNGEVLWTIDVGSRLVAPPAPADTSVYLALEDGRITAVDLYSGMPRWTRLLAMPSSNILALDDRLFVGAEDNYFYCLALKDGAIKWKWRTGGDIVGWPIVDEDRVFFLSLDNVLRALDRRSGTQQWQQAISTRTIGGPVRLGSLIVVATLSPHLQAFGSTDGKPAGSSPAPKEDDLSTTLAAPPGRIRLDGQDAFVLLTRQGALEVMAVKEDE
jgi:outer membrane protein assembly factor BamB